VAQKPHNPEMSWHVWTLHQESMRLQRLIHRLVQEAHPSTNRRYQANLRAERAEQEKAS
jgi:ABC-type Zn2+ transport system substrate-binding protein/surface adhesin